MASSPHIIWIHSARAQTTEVSLSSPVYYSSPLKAHYFTAGCVRGGPRLWTLCRGCINQTSHSGEGSTHWHGTAHSTPEDKGKTHNLSCYCENLSCLWRLLLFNYTRNSGPNLFRRLSHGPPKYTTILLFPVILVEVPGINVVLLFLFSTVDNKIFAWGNGTSGQ